MPDAFELFGLPDRFDVDQAALERVYLTRLASVHPDRHNDPFARAEAEAAAAELNDARTVLADDEQRAIALLRRLGGPDAADDKTLPDGFLMEIMTAREDMAAALATDDVEERARFEAWANEERRASLVAIADLFAKAASDGTEAGDTLREIRVRLNALRYIERMIEQLDPNYAPLM